MTGVRPLRVLLVEDVETDAELVLRELHRGGFAVTSERVETAAALTEALARGPWDVVVSDYSLPTFSAPQALRIVRGLGQELPFIIVSGTVGEDIAVESLHAGAQDFMAKGRLRRLVPAIDRELRDVALRTERKKMQEQLLISERMASMGLLAAGVAHELNNPLACVTANLELAARDIVELTERHGLAAEYRELCEMLDDAHEGAERLRTIVRDLKIFSRPEEELIGPVDVVAVMESMLRMAWNEIRHRARLVKVFDPATPMVDASEARLGQVFLNLVVNAAQAIPEGHAHEHTITVSTATAADGRVVIEIADTGTGMSPEVLEQLFRRFFTTKPLGIGTGLGLSICHRIVTGFGGTIDVTSEVGRGTTFRIALPPARRVAPVEAPAVAPARSDQRRGRILIVDDEPLVLRALTRALDADHVVVAVKSAMEALAHIAADPTFDVILTDVMMPEMTGAEFFEELRRRDPALAQRVVFLTGGAFTPSTRAFLDGVANQRIEKPFDAKRLRALLSDRLR